jgi:hypothetical protein
MNNWDIIPLTPTHGNNCSNTTAAAAPVGAPPLPLPTTTTTIGTTTSLLVGLMEDLYQEVLDHQAEKERKKEEDRNKEAQLVAGGKQIRDHVATMIVGGDRIVMGGSEVTLNDLREPSPAMSMFGSETDGSTATTSKRSRDEMFLLEAMEADRKRQRTEEVEAMEHHRDEMNMRMQELQVSHEHNTSLLTSLQAQLQQNQTMNELLQNQNKI